jgi:hypothetical protein
MKTIRELASFMQAVAAKHAALEADCGCARDITEAAQAVAAEHNADDEDVEFVASILFACWNDALAWAEARLKKPGIKVFTCPKCGSSHFGSGGTPTIRHCHGRDARCDFSFPESDDHLYFKDEDDA